MCSLRAALRVICLKRSCSFLSLFYQNKGVFFATPFQNRKALKLSNHFSSNLVFRIGLFEKTNFFLFQYIFSLAGADCQFVAILAITGVPEGPLPPWRTDQRHDPNYSKYTGSHSR